MSYSRSKNTVAIFSSIVAFIIAAAFCFFRIGFDNSGDTSLWSVFNVLALSWFIMLLPANLRRIRGSWFGVDAWGMLLGLSLVVGAGVFASFSGISLVLPFVLLGAVFFGLSLLDYLKITTVFRFMVASMLIIFYSLWLIGLVWRVYAMNPLFYEGLFYGFGNPDVLFHSAIVGMIKTFSVVSTGLDGIPYIGYHFASHWIFAQVSSLLQMRALTFYQLGFPVIFIPLFVNVMLLLILDIRRYVMSVVDFAIEKDFMFWFLFIVFQIGFLPHDFYAYLLRSARYTRYASQSYTIALLLSLLFISVLIYFWKKQTTKNSWPKTIFLLIFVPLFVGLIALAKISIGFLLIVAGGYFLWRKGLYKQRLFLAGYFFAGLIFIAVYYYIASILVIISAAGDNVSIRFFQFLGQIPLSFLPFWPLFYYLFTLVFIGFRLYKEKISSLGGFFEAVRQNKLIDVEAVIVFSVVGFLPLALLYIPHDGAGYFSDYQGLIAMLFLLAYLPVFSIAIKRFNLRNIVSLKLVHIMIIVVLLSGLITVLYNTAVQVRGTLGQNIIYRLAIVSNEGQPAPLGIIKQFIKSKNPMEIKKMLFPLYSASSVQAGLKNNKNYGLMQAISKLSELPIEEKRESLVFISATDPFWGLSENKIKLPFIVPAVTEMAMLDGIPPLKDGKPIYYEQYSYQFYPPRIKPQKWADRRIKVLSSKARQKGFSKFITLDSARGAIKKHE